MKRHIILRYIKKGTLIDFKKFFSEVFEFSREYIESDIRRRENLRK
jgi:hypothetical protein